jgi:His/Glu/Gln/Arg/opine family amino acid ABC transporter permease subunit
LPKPPCRFESSSRRSDESTQIRECGREPREVKGPATPGADLKFGNFSRNAVGFSTALFFLALAGLARSSAGSTPPGPCVLRWGGDAEGGAPFVEADPRDPSQLRGFDVEVAETIARGLGCRARFVQVAWSSIDASVARGDFDIGMSGVEDTPSRRAALLTSIPYYAFREVLTVRAGDRSRYTRLADLTGRRVGTLGATIAYRLLLQARTRYGVIPVSYDDDVHPYQDLADLRLDGVVLDNIIAARSTARVPGLWTQPEAVGPGRYIGVIARGRENFRNRVDRILEKAMRDGTLEKIYRKWNLWNPDQPQLFAAVEAGTFAPTAGSTAEPPGTAGETLRYLPALFRAALVTLLLSILAMSLAVALGIGIASGRVYGNRLLRAALTGYVELMRGTPVLLQLFVIYYGLSSVIRIPAFAAALLGLGLNYAAYESEIYRGALEAVPAGQLEAATTLGLSDGQVLRLVRGPQALRLALAPMTNDFVALLKDSSLVSVITVIELTKQTSIFATNVGSWAVPGALCAALYLAMSLPLAQLARRLERRFRAAS